MLPKPTSSLPRCIRSDAWAKSRTSSTRSCSWKALASSPAKFCTSMAARAPVTDQGRGSSPGRTPTMPIVTIQVTREGTNPGATSVTAEEKAALIKGASQLLLDVLNKPLESTFVVIDEVDTDNWGWGGLPALEYRRKLAGNRTASASEGSR